MDTHYINEQVLTSRSDVFTSMVEAYRPNRPSGKGTQQSVNRDPHDRSEPVHEERKLTRVS